MWRVGRHIDEQDRTVDSDAMFQQGDTPNDWMITLQILTVLTVSYNLTTSEEDDFRPWRITNDIEPHLDSNSLKCWWR
jgi:hypothetical protein